MCASVISPVLSLCLTSFTDNVKGADTTADSYNASTEVWYDYNTSTGWECNKKTSLPIFNNEHNSFPIHTRQIPQTQFFYTTTVLPEINTDELMDRISNFTNDVQRDIVSNQQRYCPYTDLCTVSSLLSFDKNYFKKPCCNRCSCDRKTCFIYQTCCPEIIQYPTREMLHDNNKQLMEIMGMIGEDGQVLSVLSVCLAASNWGGVMIRLSVLSLCLAASNWGGVMIKLSGLSPCRYNQRLILTVLYVICYQSVTRNSAAVVMFTTENL